MTEFYTILDVVVQVIQNFYKDGSISKDEKDRILNKISELTKKKNSGGHNI